MRQIRVMLQMYEADFHTLPPTLEALEKEGYSADRKIFLCPSRSGSIRESGPFRSDYLYSGAGGTLGGKPFLLLRDRCGNHPGLYAGGISSDGTRLQMSKKNLPAE